jgi:hypothetical protein
LVLLLFAASVILLYPFAATIAGAGDVSLTGLLTLAVLVALLRLPVAIALERDANTRGQRLLTETGLAHETERDAISRLLHAGYRVHVAFGLMLVLLISAGVAMMSLVENGLDTPTFVAVQVAPATSVEPSAPLPPMPTVDLGEGINYPLLAVLVSVATVWWAFSGKKRKPPARGAADINNDGMSRFQAGDLAGAIALFDEALRQDPGLAAAHYNRAVALASQGRNPEALAALDAMFACRTEDAEPFLCIADPWYLRGSLRLKQGELEQAEADLRQAIAIDPELTEAQERLADVLEAKNAVDKGEGCLV